MSDAQAEGPRALIIGHGAFAAGLISAVDQISGRGDLLVGVSNTGMTPEQMEETVCRYVESGIKVVFTDLPGGSATVCARRAGANLPGVVIVCGINLPALLDFVFSTGSPAENAARAAERGRETITVFPAK